MNSKSSWPRAQIPDSSVYDKEYDWRNHRSIPGSFNCVDSADPNEIIHVTRLSTGDDDGPHCKWNGVTTDVLNARLLEDITLDVTGFQLIDSKMSDNFDFLDSLNVVENYYPICEALLEKQLNDTKDVTEGRKVTVKAFDHNVRMDQSSSNVRDRELKNGGGSTIQHPVAVVHGDYTQISAPRRVELLGDPPKVNDVLRLKFSKDESLLSNDIVQDLLTGENRYALINIWRNIDARHDVSSFPLACCDARTVRKDDLRTLQIHYADRIGENYLMVNEKRHKWMYFPSMNYNEVMMIKQWDTNGSFATSSMDNEDDYACSTFAIHSAFQTPVHPEMTPRKSIEVRCLCVWAV